MSLGEKTKGMDGAETSCMCLLVNDQTGIFKVVYTPRHGVAVVKQHMFPMNRSPSRVLRRRCNEKEAI